MDSNTHRRVSHEAFQPSLGGGAGGFSERTDIMPKKTKQQ